MEEKFRSDELGVLIFFVCGILTIVIGILVSGSFLPLYTIIPLVAGMYIIEHSETPMHRGVLLGILYLLIGFAVFYTKSPRALKVTVLADLLVWLYDRKVAGDEG
jgi:vacuolar-type H+-ATPase subunit I/STV1